ncbi:MAG: putative Ig domain-containing protein [Akkermansiaceae bacterium]|nr:putative Ig domain-containing protein [Akkermansiaceae bacterium]
MRTKPPKSRALLRTLAALTCTAAVLAPGARASIAYGSINNFDTVNDTGHECHGFEIEIEDCHSSSIGYTYNYNHYGVPEISEDNSDPAHPRCTIRWASKKNADGSWASYTAIPSGPINPTNGHQFTNPSINFGGEHFGVSYRAAVGLVHYRWLIDDGSGNLVNGGNVQVATPTFTYYPAAAGAPAQVQAVIQPPPQEVHVKEFGEPVWVKEIRTTSHNNNKVHLRDLVSDDPDDPDDKNWRNGEPDEVEVEWQLLQVEFSKLDGGANGELAAAPEDLNDGDEVVTRRYEFFEYTGPLHNESGEAMADNVGPDDVHGDGVKMVNGVEVDLSTVEVVGEYKGAQMAAVDVDGHLDLVDHVGEAEENHAYATRALVIESLAPFVCTREGDLPTGMDFDDFTGELSGTPTESGEFQFKVTVSDFLSPDVEKNYTLRVAADGAALAPASLLDTAASPVGSGTTTGDGAFDPGTEVTVEATPEPGFRFVNWTDDGVVVANTAIFTFTLDVNHSLVANFEADVPQWPVAATASPAEGGSVSGDGIIDEATDATLVATAAPGWFFLNWTEDGAVVSNSSTYVFPVTAGRSLVANFVVTPTYTISANASPAEAGGTSGGGSYTAGENVTVTATASAGYVFWRWRSNGNTVGTNASYTFTAGADQVLTAEFVAAGTPQTITLSSNPDIGGTTGGGGAHLSGDEITIVATPAPNYVFSRWTESGVTVSTEPTYTFTVAGGRTLQARFTESLVITATASPAGAGEPEMDSSSYKSDENAKADANPIDGWSFVNWTENGAVVSSDESYHFSVAGPRELVANYIADDGITIAGQSSSAAGGTVSGEGVFSNGDEVVLHAEAAPRFLFRGWKEGGATVSTDADYTFLADTNRILIADFLEIPPCTVASETPGSENIVIRWPSTATGWTLEECADFGSANWLPSTRPVQSKNGNNEVIITPGGGSRFFRLAHP